MENAETRIINQNLSAHNVEALDVLCSSQSNPGEPKITLLKGLWRAVRRVITSAVVGMFFPYRHVGII